jgi:hypothetical protein
VKYIYTFLLLLGFVFASHAQQSSVEHVEGKRLDKSKSHRIASPNRISSRDWERSNKLNNFGKGHSEKDDRDKYWSNRAAIIWVDSTGATVGRDLDAGLRILVKFENEPTVLSGLLEDSNCDANFVCKFSGGARWSKFGSVNYTSVDCTGTPYLDSSGSSGTTKFGVSIFDGGETFIYIADVSQSTLKIIRSTFTNGECLIAVSGSGSSVSPAMVVVPASTFGVEPYFLK